MEIAETEEVYHREKRFNKDRKNDVNRQSRKVEKREAEKHGIKKEKEGWFRKCQGKGRRRRRRKDDEEEIIQNFS